MKSQKKNNSIFLGEDFLLLNKTASELYHNYAENLPIIDYHCHIPTDEIASNKKFDNITQIWLAGDHYKWRAMRANGVDERFITGDATDKEKFFAWAKTVPDTVRNPLYHWTHLELKNPFGLAGKLLNENTAEEIWNHCNELLQKDEFSTRGLIKSFNVEVICSTDDPVDSLEHHKKIKADGFSTKVLPAFRPDKGMTPENKSIFYPWFEKLQEVTGINITTYELYLEALRSRHNYFHENECRLSDHGLETAYCEEYSTQEIKLIFEKILLKKDISHDELLKFKSAMMYEFGLMNHEKGWIQQLHMGAQRNNNTRMYRTLGPDSGYDSMGDQPVARALAAYLNKLDTDNKLSKTILYNLNPSDTEVLVTMAGNFQDGSVAGKMQYGSAWWFLDQKNGMEKQIDALSHMGLLSRFVGMLTDSRSFLSYPRHEYFRRILCNMVGTDVENGLIPDSEDILAPLIKNVCYYNAKNYFEF
jgi:glucuronate isomerase